MVLKVGAFNEAKFCFIFKSQTLSNTLQRRETWTVRTDDPHGKEIWTWHITFWSFCQVGRKMTACYSWLHKSSLGKIPMAQFCGHCLYTESTHACHSVVRGFTGMDGYMCGVQTFVAHPSPGVASWLMLTLGPQEMGSFWRELSVSPVEKASAKWAGVTTAELGSGSVRG